MFEPDEFNESAFNHYQELANSTAIYPAEYTVTYPILGLIGEVGEFANKHKKVLRDNAIFTHEDMVSELGDILWYLAAIASDCNISLGEIASENIKKLRDRQNRGVLGGSGDHR